MDLLDIGKNIKAMEELNMSANKEKQNLRMKKVCERVHRKINYQGLNQLQVKYIKAVKEYERVNKDLDKFYTTCKRNSNGAVDWNSMNDNELDYFDYIYKKSEKLQKIISRYEEKINGDETMRIFLELNCKSVSF